MCLQLTIVEALIVALLGFDQLPKTFRHKKLEFRIKATREGILVFTFSSLQEKKKKKKWKSGPYANNSKEHFYVQKLALIHPK